MLHFYYKVRLLRALKKSKAVVTPTDTVLGLLSTDEEVIKKIKKRNKPTVRLVYQKEQISKDLPQDLTKIIEKFWPGALTIIYKKVGYRAPNNPIILEAIKKIKKPVYASSANITKNPEAKNLKEAKEVFKNSGYKIKYLNIPHVSSIPSTIFDYDNKKIIREGSISLEEIINLE